MRSSKNEMKCPAHEGRRNKWNPPCWWVRICTCRTHTKCGFTFLKTWLSESPHLQLPLNSELSRNKTRLDLQNYDWNMTLGVVTARAITCSSASPWCFRGDFWCRICPMKVEERKRKEEGWARRIVNGRTHCHPFSIKGSISTLYVKASYLLLASFSETHWEQFSSSYPSCAHRGRASMAGCLCVYVEVLHVSHYPHVKSKLLASFPAWPRALSSVTPYPPTLETIFQPHWILAFPQTYCSILCSMLCTCCSLFLESCSSPFSHCSHIVRNPSQRSPPPQWSSSRPSREVTHSPEWGHFCQSLLSLPHSIKNRHCICLPPTLWEQRFILVHDWWENWSTE